MMVKTHHIHTPRWERPEFGSVKGAAFLKQEWVKQREEGSLLGKWRLVSLREVMA